ncbi:MAG: cyclic nucleotide-binding domain-containing protein [Gammaproteobacteria bacterium]|nr:cyclic nucleotide-binding domain-containing protein [Gammaproteobacteria bacterium]NIR84584.1 cyclic nucleotide-binding domain-containing protein [Gammaproteobacteria bacterium]NIR90487.1 cyclic nucleotide-binding domain-containing protein [Gammaproteobacteria bacterium]NIU05635.1 cyclic nucleotide-binding domain-containing protein [Gammaproteobacteria bacterium]NIV52774.1 cyclic nucleotide-binding domain-containing protein [Gammaproteobacteria bacterium]
MAQLTNALLKQIKTLVPLKDLPPQDQRHILAKSKVVDYRKGKRIFKQGDRDKWVFYLLDGELEMFADDRLVNRVVAGTENGCRALAQLQPRQLTARAHTQVSVLRIERRLLDEFLTLDQGSPSGTPSGVQVSELDAEEEESVDWMSALLRSELFASMPPTNIQRILATLESVQVRSGQAIVEQGAAGDYYYIVQRGRCSVTRRTSGKEEVTLAKLREGDTFGEEALVSDSTRNATVRMMTDGELMRLTKSDFVELIKKPILESITYEKARSLVDNGAAWVDARFPDEHKQSGIDGSVNIPLTVVRAKASSLDPEKPYVVYCDDGRRSSAAAFLLKAQGLQAYHLEHGLAGTPLGKKAGPPAPAKPPAPQAKASASAAPTPRAAAPAQSRSASPAPVPAPKKQPPTAAPRPAPSHPAQERGRGKREDEGTDPEIRVSKLDSQLAHANIKLEEALTLKASAEQAAREAEAAAQEKLRKEREALKKKAKQANQSLAEQHKRAAERAVEEKLRREREQLQAEAKRASDALAEAKRLKMELETAKRAAEAEAARARKDEQERMNRLKQEAEKRLQAERSKLEQEYARTAEELARMQRMKQESEVQLAQERKRLREEAQAAKAKLAEAQRLKQELEAGRKTAEQQRRRHEEAERKLRAEVETRIKAERRKLESEFARSTQELEKAKQEKHAMDAARRAAAEEAQRVIEQYRSDYEKMRQQEEARLREERGRLEQDAQKIQQALQEARRAKQEAEGARAQAESRLSKLRADRPQKAYTATLEQAEQKLRAEMAAIEKEFKDADHDLKAAEHARDAAVEAKRVNEKHMVQQRAEVEALRQQMAAEMQEWLQEQAQQERSDAHRRSLDEERKGLARMKKREEEMKRRSDEHNRSLLDEVASQLGKKDD